ncbi:MAG: ribosomal RNA small subunit methyltransferase G [Lysobacteraceae bacterium]|nr:MAG: ribosomal RNA small subunit methyltransferase G [Xanthomonadaceae bacterium]
MSSPLPELPGPALARLEDGLRVMGLRTDLAPPLARYARLLLFWSQAYNLTAIRDPQEIVTKHLLDCLAVLPHLADGALVDVGTGAGLPGIPLALARQELRVTLVESVGKKARFLRQAVRELDLGKRVEVIEARAEAVARPGQFAQLTARALGEIARILEVAGHLLARDGRLLALKGRREEVLAETVPQGWRLEACHALAVPGLDGERHLAVVTRVLQ